jgi:hypothetical protein
MRLWHGLDLILDSIDKTTQETAKQRQFARASFASVGGEYCGDCGEYRQAAGVGAHRLAWHTSPLRHPVRSAQRVRTEMRGGAAA